MNVVAIDSINDSRIDHFRNVRDRDLLRSDLFMAEGRFVVRALLSESLYEPHSLLVTPVAYDAIKDAALAHPDVPVYVASQETMNEIVGFDIHRGCLAAGLRRVLPTIESLVADAPTRDMIVLLEDLTNHDNVGAVFRNAAAFEASAVVLTERCCDPLYRKSIRVSMASALKVPHAMVGSMREAVDVLRSAGYSTIALTPAPGAVPMRAFDDPNKHPRVALMLGEEGPGLSDEAIAAADHGVRIEMSRQIDSLNVAAAGAVAMHWFSPIHGHDR